MAVLGSENEEQVKAQSAVKREQKKLREGKTAKAPGLGGGQRVVDTAEESLRELEVIEAKQEAEGPASGEGETKTKAKPVRVRSKTYQAAKAKVNPETTYSISDGLKLLRDVSYSKANGTVELHVTLKEKGFSKEVDLPFATGKVRKVAIVDDATLKDIEAGKVNFDVLIASPSDMPKLVKLAKILGPKGLMPNPKNGTLVENPATAAKKLSGSNLISVRTEKEAPIVHTVAGKLSMADDQLTKNIQAIMAVLPQGKTTKIVLKSTMSPAIKLMA